MHEKTIGTTLAQVRVNPNPATQAPVFHADWRPWAAGSIAGSAMCLLGQPFDTTKVRMQVSSTRYRSTLHCLSHTVRTEGALALYKGLPPAMLSACTTSGLRFGVQHQFNSWLAGWLSASSSVASSASSSSATPRVNPRFEKLPAAARILAEGGGGAACGLVLPFIYTPMELIKCRRQVFAGHRVTNLSLSSARGNPSPLSLGRYWLTIESRTCRSRKPCGGKRACPVCTWDTG